MWNFKVVAIYRFTDPNEWNILDIRDFKGTTEDAVRVLLRGGWVVMPIDPDFNVQQFVKRRKKQGTSEDEIFVEVCKHKITTIMGKRMLRG